MNGYVFYADCSSVGCGSNATSCAMEDGRCRIQCGSTHFRHGEYCYHCSDIGSGTPCQECDGGGKCSRCSPGFAHADGECVECNGNTWSDDGTVCKDGVENCLLSDHTQMRCRQCNEYFTLDVANNRCVACRAERRNERIRDSAQMSEQDILDLVAHRVAQANGKECTAPQLAGCSGWCYGTSGCGEFKIGVSGNYVKVLFGSFGRDSFHACWKSNMADLHSPQRATI